jgi:hypothetical protein
MCGRNGITFSPTANGQSLGATFPGSDTNNNKNNDNNYYYYYDYYNESDNASYTHGVGVV